MGLFNNQLCNVVEWTDFKEGTLFWKWDNAEIKKGSQLIIRQGQDAIFMYNGRVEGVFADEGNFDIESQIIPFLSTLKGFRFGFNSGLRAEVLFINTRECTVNWGTKNAISIPAPQLNLPGGLPIRAFGNFTCKVDDALLLIDKVAGVRQFSVDDVKDRVVAVLDQLLMKWISKEGKDIFNLQANAFDISAGICEDLDMQMRKIGISITGFSIQSFSYPESIQKMAEKAASQAMVGDMGRYQQMAMTDAMTSAAGKGGNSSMGNTASSMAGMYMGMEMAQQMRQQMRQPVQQNTYPDNNYQQTAGGNGNVPNFCPNCGTKTTGGNFCANCGQKLV